MCRLGCVATADREKAPGGAFDDGTFERDIGRRIARNGSLPAVSEAHVDKIDMTRFPEKEAVEPKVHVARIRTGFTAFLHLVGDFVREFLMGIAIACRCTIRWRVAEINAAQFANGLAQRLTDNDCRGSGECAGPIHLSANDELVLSRPVPS